MRLSDRQKGWFPAENVSEVTTDHQRRRNVREQYQIAQAINQNIQSWPSIEPVKGTHMAAELKAKGARTKIWGIFKFVLHGYIHFLSQQNNEARQKSLQFFLFQ